MFDDDIWDEERWEVYLRERDQHTQRYMQLFFGFVARYPAPERGDLDRQARWLAAWNRYLDALGLTPETYPLAFLFDHDHLDDHAEWLENLEADPLLDGAPFQQLPIYQQTHDLVRSVLRWSHALPGDQKDSSLVQYCNALMQLPAQLAKGHGLGYEHEQIGGNIACAKRALAAANEALQHLHDMRTATYMDTAHYFLFYEATYEARNAIALYIQSLRSRFDLGID